MANPCYTQIHPACIPVSGDHQSKLTLMSEGLRNDGRIWVPKKKEDCDKDPRDIPEEDRDYYLERIYPSFGNLVPRDIASRQAKNMCDEGRGVGPVVGDFRRGVYLDFADAIKRLGKDGIEEKYDNLLDMYERITGENPYEVPMRIYPAVHYVMGGLWVDYNLESNLEGLFVTGEANFSDHGANRLGASALMQGLADGYFVLPNTIREYLADDDQLVLFDIYDKCADALSNGQVDIVTTDNVILLGFVSKSEGEFKLVGEQFTEEPYGIGITKGDVEFCELINETLAENEDAYLAAWDRTAGEVEGTEKPELPEADASA